MIQPSVPSSPPADQTCPQCEGSGKSNLIPLCAKTTHGGPMTKEAARNLADMMAKCSFCEGVGKVTSEQLEWRRIGWEWHQARFALGVGLREWAERVGVSPAEYCQMENGTMKPD